MKRSAFKRTESLNHTHILLIILVVTLSPLAISTITTSSFAFAEQDAKEQQGPVQNSSQIDVRELKLGEPIERQLAGGDSHSYRVMLTVGQYLRVLVEQKGIDVVVRLFGPDATRITEVNSPNLTLGPEPVSLIATAPGSYRLEVVSTDKGVAQGRYEIAIKKLGEATVQDKDRLGAERSFFEARQLQGLGKAELLRKAIDKYNEILPLWRALNDVEQVAVTINQIGETHYQLGDTQKALEHFNQALLIWNKHGDRRGEATALKNIGDAHQRLGDSQTALRYLHQALPIWSEVGDQPRRAITLTNIGLATNYLGKPYEALDYYHQSLAIQRALGDRLNEAATLNNIAATHFRFGDFQRALEYFSLALPLKQATGDLRGQSVILNNIGSIYWRLGEYEKATEYHNQTLSLARTTGDRHAEAAAVLNLGLDEWSLGKTQKALDHYHQSLSLVRALGNRRGEAFVLMELGRGYQSLRDFDKALDSFQQALQIQRDVGDRWGEANTLGQMGDCYSAMGKPQENLSFLHQALALHRAVGDQSTEAESLRLIARAEFRLNRLNEARDRIEAALRIIESTRSTFISQKLRTSYSASTRSFYDLYIGLLMRMHKVHPSLGHDTVALQVSERARARSLLEILTESRSDIRQGVDPVLLELERSVQRQLNATSEKLTRLLGGKHTEEQATAIRKEVDTLVTEYQDVQAQIRRKSPRYAALTQPQPLSVKEIQQLLDKDTLLLEYALGEEQSYVWVVTPTSVSSFELPRRADIEASVRKFYELVTARKNRDLDTQVEAAADLSRMLLMPVADQLLQKRLLIVGEGPLLYVPFAALPEPAVSGPRSVVKRKNSESYQPLVVKHEIVNLPSASVLAVLRRELAGRLPSPRALAVLADPVFRADDPRLKTQAPKLEKTASGSLANSDDRGDVNSEVERSAWESGAEKLPRLFHSRDEAKAIAQGIPASQVLLALDFGANREIAVSGQLEQYRIVHFATHGLINNVHPELSGIVLSLVDETGRPQNGFVRLHDVYNLKVPAELVVLSGCRTALGKEVRGEGLIGLTRGFMYAGSPRVVVSLWPVSDKGTAELMKRFYGGMLGKGLRPAAALRAAQIEMWKTKWWDAPYYWAGFVLQGEWR